MADQASEGLLSPFLKSKRIKACGSFLTGRVLDFGCGSGGVAGFVAPENFLGIERDSESRNVAKKHFPQHEFVETMGADHKGMFDTVVSLAVIEHVDSPAEFLAMLASALDDSRCGTVVITTPHPRADWLHNFGAKIGLFSSHASDEHEELLDKTKLEAISLQSGLELIHYSRFLLGANQLAVFRSRTGVSC